MVIDEPKVEQVSPMGEAVKALYELTASPDAIFSADDFYVLNVENGTFDDKRGRVRLQGKMTKELIARVTTVGYELKPTDQGWLVAKEDWKGNPYVLDITLT